MGVWSAAVVLCGLAPNFATLMVARVFVGVGEASFVALAAPFIGARASTLPQCKAPQHGGGVLGVREARRREVLCGCLIPHV